MPTILGSTHRPALPSSRICWALVGLGLEVPDDNCGSEPIYPHALDELSSRSPHAIRHLAGFAMELSDDEAGDVVMMRQSVSYPENPSAVSNLPLRQLAGISMDLLDKEVNSMGTAGQMPNVIHPVQASGPIMQPTMEQMAGCSMSLSDDDKTFLGEHGTVPNANSLPAAPQLDRFAMNLSDDDSSVPHPNPHASTTIPNNTAGVVPALPTARHHLDGFSLNLSDKDVGVPVAILLASRSTPNDTAGVVPAIPTARHLDGFSLDLSDEDVSGPSTVPHAVGSIPSDIAGMVPDIRTTRRHLDEFSLDLSDDDSLSVRLGFSLLRCGGLFTVGFFPVVRDVTSGDKV